MSDLVDLQLKNKYMYAPNNVSVCYLFFLLPVFMNETL